MDIGNKLERMNQITTDDDIRLILVAEEIRKLKLKISDAAWENKPTESLEQQLAYFEELQRNGIDVEPTF